jgi:hypothetical protein
MSDGEQVAVPRQSTCGCKLGRQAERYGLDRLDDRLLDHREDGASLRRLETVVNEAILRAALQRADTEFGRDVSAIYRKLTDDDTSAGVRTETEGWLSRTGIEPDELRGDFVSYQTVRTHLRNCLDVDTNRERTLSVEDAEGTIEWARSRSGGIVERTIERLRDTDGFTSGSVEVSHVIRVSCADCGASYPVERFLERGGCECDTDG